jgi:hypothetical protein
MLHHTFLIVPAAHPTMRSSCVSALRVTLLIGNNCPKAR